MRKLEQWEVEDVQAILLKKKNVDLAVKKKFEYLMGAPGKYMLIENDNGVYIDEVKGEENGA
jgi:hypothetical protein